MIRIEAEKAGLIGNVEPPRSWNGMEIMPVGETKTVLLSKPERPDYGARLDKKSIGRKR